MNAGIKRMISFAAIILGFFMALLDATIVNIALPEMARHYGVEMESISWIVNGYNLAFAVFILTAARLADQFGRKKVFIMGTAAFTAASVLAGFAPDVGSLIALRIVQGLAGAIVVPVTIPLATELFPKEKHGLIIGVWGAVSGLAAASGPTVGGFLTSNFAWQSIFFVNAPIGVLAIVLSLVLLRESYDPTATKRVDWAGVGAISGAMFCLVFALINANDYGWGSPSILALFAGSLALFAAFFAIESKVKDPMLPLSLLKIPVFNWASVTLFIVGAGLMSSIFLMSFFLTQVLGLGTLDAGITISTLPLLSMVGSAVAGPLSNKLGARWFAAAGMAVLAFAVWSFSGMDAAATRWDAVWRLGLAGLGLGFSMAPVMAAAVRNVPEDKVGMSSGVTNMTRALGGVLGIAAMVGCLNGFLPPRIEAAKADAVAKVAADKKLLVPLRKAFSDELGKADAARRQSLSMDLDGILGEIDTRFEGITTAGPDRSEADAALARKMVEGQKDEVRKIYPGVVGGFRSASASAFSDTFKIDGAILVLGVLAGFFSDGRRRRGEALANADREAVILVD